VEFVISKHNGGTPSTLRQPERTK